MARQIVLVTGANGFLGSEVVRCLRAESLTVRATGLESTSHQEGIDYYQANILQEGQIGPAVAGVSTIIHTAGFAHVFVPDATTDDHFRQINENGTANLASVAVNRGVKHFILISSVSVYGSSTHGDHGEDALCNPTGPYAISKHNAEQRAEEIAQKSGMALTILRLATLYGEGDRGNVNRLVSAINRRRFIWIGNGSNRKSLLYKGDAARAILSVLPGPPSGINKYNVSAPPCTMYSIVSRIAFESAAAAIVAHSGIICINCGELDHNSDRPKRPYR